MDFDHALHSHSKRKLELRRVLAKHDHSLDPAEVALDHKCVLGQWIYGEGAQHFNLPEFAKLKFEHSRYHQIAAELVRRANAGKSVAAEMEPCSASDFSTASAAMILAIIAMKQRLSRELAAGASAR
jgi:hypothetical protein